MRGITRWLQDKEKQEGKSPSPSATLQQRAMEMDEAMIEEFDYRDDRLMERLSKAKMWGTEEGLQTYRTERMEIWGEVFSEFLPTFDPPSED